MSGEVGGMISGNAKAMPEVFSARSIIQPHWITVAAYGMNGGNARSEPNQITVATDGMNGGNAKPIPPGRLQHERNDRLGMKCGNAGSIPPTMCDNVGQVVGTDFPPYSTTVIQSGWITV